MGHWRLQPQSLSHLWTAESRCDLLGPCEGLFPWPTEKGKNKGCLLKSPVCYSWSAREQRRGCQIEGVPTFGELSVHFGYLPIIAPNHIMIIIWRAMDSFSATAHPATPLAGTGRLQGAAVRRRHLCKMNFCKPDPEEWGGPHPLGCTKLK